MTTTSEAIRQQVNATKHSFRLTGGRLGKSEQRRYERRKTKELIRLQEWQEQEA